MTKSTGFAKKPLVVGWNLLMCSAGCRKQLHHPGGCHVREENVECAVPADPTAWNLLAGSHALPSPFYSLFFPFPFCSSISAPWQEIPLGWVRSCQQPQQHVWVGKGDVFGVGKGDFLALAAQGALPALNAMSLFALCSVPAASWGIWAFQGCFEGAAPPWG